MTRRALLAAALSRLVLRAQDFSELQVEKAALGYRFTDGPVWSKEGYLLFSDVPAGKILKYSPEDGKASVFREASNGAAGNALDGQGRLYTCETHARRVTRTDKKGRVEVLAERWEGKRLNAPNDVVVSKSGHVYFTDPAFGNQSDTRELDFYGVYHITPKGQITVVAKPVGRPNGITLSPNGRVLYVTNSDERNIRAYEVGHDGEVSGERVLAAGVEGIPDGIRTDENGTLYVAAKGIAVYNAEGKLLATIPLAEKPSNCTFGDADLKSLYVTARKSLFRIRLDVKGSGAN